MRHSTAFTQLKEHILQHFSLICFLIKENGNIKQEVHRQIAKEFFVQRKKI